VESYRRALELRPDLPEARVGIARGYIREGRLDEARKMLAFLEKSGTGQLYSLEPLETLAYAYQSRGQHQEALDLFSRLIEELPKVAEHPAFRKAVAKSEKVVNRGPSMLPKQKFSFKRLFQTSGGRSGQPVATARTLAVVGVIIALVFLVFAFSNEYIRHHRKVYLVNGYETPATVDVRGAGTVSHFSGVQKMVLPEGRHHAVISGPVNEEVDFEIHDDYFNRWFGDDLWVINVGGGALLELSEATYSENPQPVVETFHIGQTFEHFFNVTHPFKPLPKSVQVQSGGNSRTLVGLDVFDGDATDVFAYYQKKNGINPAMAFAETWLHAHPDDEMLLGNYALAAQKEKQVARFDTFLRSGLTNRPVRISWHRTYQNLHNHKAERAMLASQYDGMLHENLTNSAMLYLRGRVETNHALAHDYFARASAADPRNPYAAFALGYDRMTAGDWKESRPLLARAVELDPHDIGFANLLFVNRIALGEAQLVEQELRKKLARDPMDYFVQFELIDALAAEGKSEQALMAADNFAALCKVRYGSSGDKVAAAAKYRALYTSADFEKLKSVAAKDASSAGQSVMAMALIEQGQPDAAAKALPVDLDSDDQELFYFALAIAYHQSGNETAAAQWRSRGIETLENGNYEEIEAASLLTRGASPTRAEVENVSIPPQIKAVILTVLIQEYPQSRAQLGELARALNMEQGFPHHLIQRATAAAL
jgi:tetratricopeptide (TPR) repeat protein